MSVDAPPLCVPFVLALVLPVCARQPPRAKRWTCSTISTADQIFETQDLRTRCFPAQPVFAAFHPCCGVSLYALCARAPTAVVPLLPQSDPGMKVAAVLLGLIKNAGFLGRDGRRRFSVWSVGLLSALPASETCSSASCALVFHVGVQYSRSVFCKRDVSSVSTRTSPSQVSFDATSRRCFLTPTHQRCSCSDPMISWYAPALLLVRSTLLFVLDCESSCIRCNDYYKSSRRSRKDITVHELPRIVPHYVVAASDCRKRPCLPGRTQHHGALLARGCVGS